MERLGARTLGSLPRAVEVPGYLDEDLRIGIVHFGVGNFHRSHQAMYVERLLNAGTARDWAICGVGLLDRDARMRDALAEQDGLYTLTLREPDGSNRFSVIGAIRRFIYAPDDPAALLEQLVSPDVRIVSLTVTEGGYVSDPTTGRSPQDDPLVIEEVAGGLAQPRTAFGWIVAALRERRRRGTAPFTVMSCDNIQGNGRVARLSVEGVARLVDAELADWIAAEVSFPSTMVDRITPVTTQTDVDRIATELGVEDAWPVSSEPFTQWVIEDVFAHGRPPFEQAGAVLVSDIDPYEAIKLRLLNASHQALAYIGQLMGYEYVHEAVADARIAGFVRAYMEQEAVPTLVVPAGFEIAEYIDELFVRFGNPHVQDFLARLSVDSSNRIPKFLVPVLADGVAAGAASGVGASIIATWRAWCRGVDAGQFAIDDVDGKVLVSAAAQEPLGFLRGVPTLTPFLESPSFVDAYERAANALEQEGPEAFLGAVLVQE
ncbi:mannitol dehydrogenase family protein [Cellulomonas chengniuliangii]|uniref:Mannitol-1-phosphate 5-dehydrogenase n=1 Tax=Cellulomonas chengniuliangii TaxID=2968084 RepID=A0ABY5L1K8_9CELL|nr:mannitol dehydrogenase family protein [Cellulomonas chengniuliangii]MCC2308297.1 mannitol dehydrogenase family protein [Cellulomonas chengniuliangii]UUI76681.1 mannitol dehydrogenase family protein [Cellulomonas chengniuliangii]